MRLSLSVIAVLTVGMSLACGGGTAPTSATAVPSPAQPAGAPAVAPAAGVQRFEGWVSQWDQGENFTISWGDDSAANSAAMRCEDRAMCADLRAHGNPKDGWMFDIQARPARADEASFGVRWIAVGMSASPGAEAI